MQGIKTIFFAVLILVISIMSGCTPNTVQEKQNKKEVSADVVKNSSKGVSGNIVSSDPAEQQEKTSQLAWRIEEQMIDDSIRSYLYLQSADNEAIAIKLGYLVGEVFDLKDNKDRYPEDGIIPINSWYGGAGVEVVGRYLDEYTLAIMVRPIGDGLEYGSSWDDYEEWYRVSISYDEQGKIARLSGEEVMNLNEEEEVMQEPITVDDFFGSWKIIEVAWEPKQHNYIGEIDQLIGSTVTMQKELFEIGEDRVVGPILSVEKVDESHFLSLYAGGAEQVAAQHTDIYGLRIEDDNGKYRYMYYMDGEIWCEYKGELLFKLEKEV